MPAEIPRLALVAVKTLTPIHVGADSGEAIRIDLGRGRGKMAYIPGATMRGWLRALYTGAVELAGAPEPETKAAEIFGSTERAGSLAFDDLLMVEGKQPKQQELRRWGEPSRGSPRQFSLEMVPSGCLFSGLVSYTGGALPEVLGGIFAEHSGLGDWLKSWNGTDNPETKLHGSPINDPLFRRSKDKQRWVIKWKLGKLSKSYAKALTAGRKLGALAPHAYYLLDGTNEAPGWVEVHFLLTLSDDQPTEFRLNDWREWGKL